MNEVVFVKHIWLAQCLANINQPVNLPNFPNTDCMPGPTQYRDQMMARM